MIKLNASFSKKVPGSEEYSSEGYMCAVELELSDNMEPEQLNTKIHETFELVRSSVEAELGGRTLRVVQPSQSARPGRSSGPNGNGKASNKQLKYLLDLASERGIELSRLNSRLAERYGVSSVYELTRHQASQALDDLKSVRRQQAAA